MRFVCAILKGHNGDLPIMRVDPRTLLARKRGQASRRIDNERDRDLIGAAVTINVNLPNRVASYRAL